MQKRITKNRIWGGVKTGPPQKLAFWAFLSSFLLLTLPNQAQSFSNEFHQLKAINRHYSTQCVLPLSNDNDLTGGYATLSTPNQQNINYVQPFISLISPNGNILWTKIIESTTTMPNINGASLFRSGRVTKIMPITGSSTEFIITGVQVYGTQQPQFRTASDTISPTNIHDLNFQSPSEFSLGLESIQTQNNGIVAHHHQKSRVFVARINIASAGENIIVWYQELELNPIRSNNYGQGTYFNFDTYFVQVPSDYLELNTSEGILAVNCYQGADASPVIVRFNLGTGHVYQSVGLTGRIILGKIKNTLNGQLTLGGSCYIEETPGYYGFIYSVSYNNMFITPAISAFPFTINSFFPSLSARRDIMINDFFETTNNNFLYMPCLG